MGWAVGWRELEPRRERVRGIVVHRIEVSQEDASFGDTAEETARFFREHPIGKKATGGAMPYPILVAADGSVTQAVPLDRVTPHAVSHNPTTIGVACVGDFRRHAPGETQYRALLAVCRRLLEAYGLEAAAVRGHDELAGASREPDKICPGPGLSVATLRDDLAECPGPDEPEVSLVLGRVSPAASTC